MQEMSKTIGRLAPMNVNVLIVGESGTGKELVARALYQHSRRSEMPFLAINCAAFPRAWWKASCSAMNKAFSGAIRQRIGKFEQCDGGTILLDEIGDMPLTIQAKMLRVLQEQKFERLGGSKSLSTDVRILAATNQNLEQLVFEEKFRKDLYYRLKGVTLHVPPLRERKEDIHELAHHFLFQFDQRLNLDIESFSTEVMDAFMIYSWPGNVRELQGVIKESMLKTVGRRILFKSLPQGFLESDIQEPRSRPNGSPESLTSTIDNLLDDGLNNVHERLMNLVEKELLIRTLRFTKGHQSRASDVLGINRATLRNKIRELGIALDKRVSDAKGQAEISMEE